jgi:hypothetical protein
MQVDKKELEKLLDLLNQAQYHRDFGDTKAYALERQARQLVESILKGGDDAKSTP